MLLQHPAWLCPGRRPGWLCPAGSSCSPHDVPALLPATPLSSIGPALAALGEAQSTAPKHRPHPLSLRSLSPCPARQNSTSKSGTRGKQPQKKLPRPTCSFSMYFPCISLCTGGFLSAMLPEVRGGSAAPLHGRPRGSHRARSAAGAAKTGGLLQPNPRLRVGGTAAALVKMSPRQGDKAPAWGGSGARFVQQRSAPPAAAALRQRPPLPVSPLGTAGGPAACPAGRRDRRGRGSAAGRARGGAGPGAGRSRGGPGAGRPFNARPRPGARPERRAGAVSAAAAPRVSSLLQRRPHEQPERPRTASGPAGGSSSSSSPPRDPGRAERPRPAPPPSLRSPPPLFVSPMALCLELLRQCE